MARSEQAAGHDRGGRARRGSRRLGAVRHLPASRMANLGKVLVAGVGAKMLTGSLVGFVLVFLLLMWLLGGF